MQASRTLYFSVVVALAGFLFGFDTVVISGADKALQELWNSTDLFHGVVVMSTALWGTVIGALFGSVPTNRLGRKVTLIGIGLLFLISAVGSAAANSPWVFALFRFTGGLGIGISTIAAPAYVSEIAPAGQRGKLVALYQFNIVFGILIAFISNYLLRNSGESAWRFMLGVEALPAFVYVVLVSRVPESPRWLLDYRNNEGAARRTLLSLLPESEAENELKSMRNEKKEELNGERIYQPKYRRALLLAFFIALFNQLSGINAFLYYAPRIFELAGMAKSTALLSTIGVGIINLICTLIGISMIDRFGRRTLMLIGSVGYIVSLGLVTVAFKLGWSGMSVPVFFFLFIAAHAVGQGAVIWVFISEIFPTRLRASGQAFGSSVHWFLAAAIPSLIPYLFTAVGPASVFAFFCVMMVFQLFWVLKRMPETKGKRLEDLSKSLILRSK
ncbi:MAG: sugar porter family MFS transporter [Flavobacteriales bacterium]|nr:sugar porter family MFS transporter [Flavobacteriales bacterium]